MFTSLYVYTYVYIFLYMCVFKIQESSYVGTANPKCFKPPNNSTTIPEFSGRWLGVKLSPAWSFSWVLIGAWLCTDWSQTAKPGTDFCRGRTTEQRHRFCWEDPRCTLQSKSCWERGRPSWVACKAVQAHMIRWLIDRSTKPTQSTSKHKIWRHFQGPTKKKVAPAPFQSDLGLHLLVKTSPYDSYGYTICGVTSRNLASLRSET